MLLEKAKHAKASFTDEDCVAALESIFQAMLVSGYVVDASERAHLDRFTGQLHAMGVDASVLETEPYLEEVRLNFQLQFLQRMETLFVRTESYLHDRHGTEEKTGIHLYAGNSEAWLPVDAQMAWKAVEYDEPLTPQIETRIARETQRLSGRMDQHLDMRRQLQAGVETYIWRSRDDDKVRAAHAGNDDRVFRWDDPPPGGHPGQDYGCRCYAEPLPPDRLPDDPPIEPVYPLEMLAAGIGITRGAWVVAAFALRRIGAIVNKAGQALRRWQGVIADKTRQAVRRLQEEIDKVRQGLQEEIDKIRQALRRWQDERLFRRPEGVPEDWVRKPSKTGDGMVYEEPGTYGANYVKIQRARPDSSQLGQRFDNVRWMRNGQSLDAEGKIVPMKSLESHIPVKKFKFNPELFK